MSGVPYGRTMLSVGASQAAAGVLKVALPIAVARILDPDEFGVYSVTIVVVLLVFNLGNLGLSPSVTYNVARGDHRHDVASYNTLLLGLLLGGVGMVAGGAVVLGFRDELVRGAGVDLLVCAFSAVPTYYVVNAAMGYFIGLEDYRSYNALNVAFYLAVLVATLAALTVSPTAIAAVAGWSGGSLAVAAVAAGMLRRRWQGGRRVDRAYWRDTTAYGARSHVSGVLTFLNYRVDILLVATFLGSDPAGLYAAAVAIGEIVWFFSQVSSWVLFSQVVGGSDARRRRTLTATTSRLVVLASGTAALPVAVSAPTLLSVVYGPGYAGAANALRILMIGVVALSVSRVLANFVAALGRPERNIPGSVLGLIVNVALNVLLIPEVGMTGAALASAVSYSVTLMHRLWLYRRVDGDVGDRAALAECLLPRPRDVVAIGQTLGALRVRPRHSGDVEHAVQRDARPLGGALVDGDLVHDLAANE